ncbi:restriction endonuclease subunit R [Leifsonia poae]|uniref:restriction endonuclease subunit R n=1 Tax=Leifsonia poae TaxID=110933 RepID=UPI003D684C7E
MNAALPSGWTLSASVFNWTPDIIRAEREAPEIALDVVRDGVAQTIELELGQLWRSFPDLADDELRAFRSELDGAGGRVSIVGVNIDDWATPTRRRDDEERYDFLVPQLRAAATLGAHGARLPIGQAGPALLRRLQPLLAELDLVLYEEIQGQQHPASAAAPAIEDIAALDDPRVRLLIDVSLLMPALPPSYLQRLEDAGLPPSLLSTLADDWRDPATGEEVVAVLRSGAVPPQVHTLYMNLLVRFGRSTVDDLRPILPLTGAFHLKFWDVDDSEDRVSAPLRDLGAALADTDFTGTFCSEWGGHEWLDDETATDITRRQLELARTALAAGAAAGEAAA